MRIALINPPWSFEGSIYFGCREPHLPLELAYTRDLLAGTGHTAELFDAHLFPLDGRRTRASRRRLPARDDRDHHGADVPVLALRTAGAAGAAACPVRARRGGRSAASGLRSGPTARRRRARHCASSASMSSSWASARRRWRAWRRESATAFRASPIAGTAATRGSTAARRRPVSSMRRRSSGRRRGLPAIHHHHHRFDASPDDPGRRWKPRADAPTTAASAPRKTSATATAGDCCPRCWPRSTV